MVSNSACNQRDTTRPGGPVGFRKAETQTLVSSRATMSTVSCLDLGPRAGHLLLDDLLRSCFGADFHPAKQTLEFVTPLRLLVQRNQDVRLFFQSNGPQRSQDPVLKNRPKSLFHRIAPLQSQQHGHCNEASARRSRKIRSHRRSMVMRGDQFQRDENRRVWRQAQRRQILTSKVQVDSFLQVATDIIERRSLGDNRDFQTLSHTAGLLPASDHRLNGTLQHRYLLSVFALKWAKKAGRRYSTEGRDGIARNGLPRCFRRRAKTPDLPAEESEKFDLFIKLKAAKSLGLTIPPVPPQPGG